MSTRAPIYSDRTFTPPGPANAFGPMITGFDVEQLLAQRVRHWLPCYLEGIALQRDMPVGKLPPFRAEVPTSFDANRLREDQYPAMAVVATGITERPALHQERYAGRFLADLHCVCRAGGNREARFLAQLYAAAVRTLVLQPHREPRTNLAILRIDLLGERYTVRTPSEERTLGEGVVRLSVHVDAITDRSTAPWVVCQHEIPRVEQVDLTVTKKED